VAYIDKTVNTVCEEFFTSELDTLLKKKKLALLSMFMSTGDPNCDFVFNDVTQELMTNKFDLLRVSSSNTTK
jgi:hypothetical protein